MTIIFAFKKDNEIWLASDQCISDNDVVYYSKLDSKTVKLENAIIGASGDCTMRNHLELFVTLKNNLSAPFASKTDVMHFFINFKRYLSRVAGLGDAEHNQIQNLHNSDFLIATRDKMFWMDEDCGIMEFDKFVAIGRGKEMGTALLDYLFTYKKSLSPQELTSRIMKVVFKYQNTCGGKVTLTNVTNDLVTVQTP